MSQNPETITRIPAALKHAIGALDSDVPVSLESAFKARAILAELLVIVETATKARLSGDDGVRAPTIDEYHAISSCARMALGAMYCVFHGEPERAATAEQETELCRMLARLTSKARASLEGWKP